MAEFKAVIERIRQGDKATKIEEIKNLLSLGGLINHYTHKDTKKIVLANCKDFEYDHEHHTSKKLTTVNYNVLFVPKGYFKRSQKKHDVFLIKEHIFLEADLKCIYTTNTDTIGNAIKEGSEQAKSIVVDVHANIERKRLIEGLQTGCERNELLSEILLFYNSQFYKLPKSQVLSNKIFNVIK